MLKGKIRYAQSIISLSHILLSSLHVWSIDKNLDKLFGDKLDLKKPKYPIAFGRISRGSHFFVMFPQKKTAFNFSQSAVAAAATSTTSIPRGPIPKEKSFNLINFSDESAVTGGADEETKGLVSGSNSSQSIATDIETPSPSIDIWLASKVITTEHLVTILAISNAFMNLQSFIDLQIKKELERFL